MFRSSKHRLPRPAAAQSGPSPLEPSAHRRTPDFPDEVAKVIDVLSDAALGFVFGGRACSRFFVAGRLVVWIVAHTKETTECPDGFHTKLSQSKIQLRPLGVKQASVGARIRPLTDERGAERTSTFASRVEAEFGSTSHLGTSRRLCLASFRRILSKA